jgi:hypothetical protein
MFTNRRRYFQVLLLFLSLTFGTGTARAAPAQSLSGRYFLVVWSYQGPDDDIVHAHTFASFYNGNDLARGVVHPATISWLPASGVVHLFGDEKGRNFSLASTLHMACQAGRSVDHWGPFEIKHGLYLRAQRRIALLQSGRFRYEMLPSSPNAMNCIKAAGDITPDPLHTGILWGVAAGAAVTHHLSPYFVGGSHETIEIPGILRSCSRAEKHSRVQEAGSSPRLQSRGFKRRRVRFR